MLSAAAAEYYVSPEGRSTAVGSLSDPWDLATALGHPAEVQPADTIWVRGGTYIGAFVSRLRGAEEAPIIVRRYRQEQATLQGRPDATTLGIEGAHTWFWGLEFAGPPGPRTMEYTLGRGPAIVTA
jgi:hypothetical protein